MKIIKRIALVFGILIGIYLIIGLFTPSKAHIERTLFMQVNSTTVFNEINTLTHWKSWSYWDNIDPKMKSEFEGPESGVGAKHLWESTNDSVGKGSLTITKSEPGKFVETELWFEGMGTSVGGWKIRDTTGGVLVTTYMDVEFPFYAGPMLLFMNMDKALGGDFEKSLYALHEHCKSLSSADRIAEIRIEATTMPPMKIMTISDSCYESEISMRLGMLYGEIGAEMNKQGLTQAGAPFGIYHVVTTKDTVMYFRFEAGIQIDKPGKSNGRVEYKETTGGNVVKGLHYGPYDKTPTSHDQLSKWILANGKTVTGSPWEVYVTDPGAEPDPAKWLTEIYYPIQ